ncbi:MAG: hypothetical protein IJU21_03250 [Bacteroidales bacterium]|nr:hypothetical protein [Bacteroidales bacterium]
MRKLFLLFCMAAMAWACGSDKSAELYVPKNTVEFAGNAFTSFSLGSDVKLYTSQNPDASKEWTVQAVIPIRKEVKGTIDGLSINLTPLDDRGIRIRDNFVLEGEDLANLVPVYNSADNIERTIVFSVAQDGVKKYFSKKDAEKLLANTKGVRMDFNVSSGNGAASAVQATPAQPENPNTLDGLCKKYGVYGLLGQYEAALRSDNSRRAKQIEDQLWSIEKRVKNDGSVPSWLRDRFVEYIEDREDEIEDRWD